MKNFLLKNYFYERKRRIKYKKVFDKTALLEWKRNIKTMKTVKNKRQLQSYFNYAKNLKYSHNNSKVYFSHPLRVANLAFKISKYSTSPKNLVILGLFHNILETSNEKISFLEKLIGKKILRQIKILTVNRNKQWNLQYKAKYYRNISLQNKNTRLIKIIDKLDNLFTIGLNSSKIIRKRYISEIEQHILPMVKKDLPILVKYFDGLIKQSYILGYYGSKRD
tara:strand:+ start:38 stop:703 length:666 start_codon:yes stop_codon:yes gene_type:complete